MSTLDSPVAHAAPLRLITLTRAALLDLRGAPYADVTFLQQAAHSALIVLVADRDAGALASTARALEEKVGGPFRFDAEMSNFVAAEARTALAKRFGALVEKWAHVSTQPHVDAPLATQGAEILSIVREDRFAAGNNDAGAAEPTAWLPDLAALADLLAARGGAPVLYTVTAYCHDAATATRFVHWMRWEHGRDLLAVPGVTSYRILAADEKTVRNEYLFTNDAALSAYLDGAAAALRAKGRERFTEAEVRFERQVLRLLGGAESRAPGDFRAFSIATGVTP